MGRPPASQSAADASLGYWRRALSPRCEGDVPNRGFRSSPNARQPRGRGSRDFERRVRNERCISDSSRDLFLCRVRSVATHPMSTNREYAVETDGLTRRFGEFVAVDHVSLRIPKGALYGFLGLNGAGKT